MLSGHSPTGARGSGDALPCGSRPPSGAGEALVCPCLTPPPECLFPVAPPSSLESLVWGDTGPRCLNVEGLALEGGLGCPRLTLGRG